MFITASTRVRHLPPILSQTNTVQKLDNYCYFTFYSWSCVTVVWSPSVLQIFRLVKLKLFPIHIMKPCSGLTDIAPPILNVGGNRRQLDNFTSCPLYPWVKKTPVPTVWIPEPGWTFWRTERSLSSVVLQFRIIQLLFPATPALSSVVLQFRIIQLLYSTTPTLAFQFV
jgi:hypothetical protein